LTNVLVDTDVCVDHLRGTPFRPRGDRIHYSVVTRTELIAGGDERRVRGFLEPLQEIGVDRSIADRAGRIRRETGIDLADAVIAATAIEHRLVLASRNTKDFARVRGLRLRDMA
jgi:hypothetical protein